MTEFREAVQRIVRKSKNGKYCYVCPFKLFATRCEVFETGLVLEGARTRRAAACIKEFDDEA